MSKENKMDFVVRYSHLSAIPNALHRLLRGTALFLIMHLIEYPLIAAGQFRT